LVKFLFENIATIRHKDWDMLKDYFIIPEPIRTIDCQKTVLKNKKLIPMESNGNNKKPLLINERDLFRNNQRQTGVIAV